MFPAGILYLAKLHSPSGLIVKPREYSFSPFITAFLVFLNSLNHLFYPCNILIYNNLQKLQLSGKINPLNAFYFSQKWLNTSSKTRYIYINIFCYKYIFIYLCMYKRLVNNGIHSMLCEQ